VVLRLLKGTEFVVEIQNDVLLELESSVREVGFEIYFARVPLVEKEVARGMVPKIRMRKVKSVMKFLDLGTKGIFIEVFQE
jgi:hypothetical protein